MTEISTEELAQSLESESWMAMSPELRKLIRQAAARLRALAEDAERLEEDVQFLLQRANRAGSFSCDRKRDYGASSNSLVYMAYEGLGGRLELPMDRADLSACELAYDRLPAHRKTGRVNALLDLQRQAIDKARHD